MKARVLTAAAAVVLSMASSFAVAVPAVAGTAVNDPGLPPKCPSKPSAAAMTADRAEFDRIWVRMLATNDPRRNLNSAAWAALLSSNPKATIARFVECGYDYSRWSAAQAASRNADFARRVAATHTAQYSPHVHAAATLALQQGTAALAVFASTGYQAALKRDQANRDADSEQAKAIVQADRKFVTLLRDSDPGPQVRAAAGWALRDGSTDVDLVEFFAFDWASAASLDLLTHRTARADQEFRWRQTVLLLVAEAKVAEKAALEAAGEAAVQARAAAARAWAAVGPKTVEPRSAWAEAEQIALAQADNWRQVAAAAAAASSPNWAAISGTAAGTEGQWDTERTNAAALAADWTALYEQALAGERRMQTPAG